MIQRFLILVVIIGQMVACELLFSQVPNDSSVTKLKDEILKFSLDATMKTANWGICVITADSQKTVVAYNDSLGLIPASTMKAINTAATISMLGKDFTFKTYLFYDGRY